MDATYWAYFWAGVLTAALGWAVKLTRGRHDA